MNKEQGSCSADVDMEKHGQTAGPEELQQNEALSASEEAVAFMDSVDPAALQRCVFTDDLASVSESGQDLGRFSVAVEIAYKSQRPCMMVHAQSRGAIEKSVCGTSVTAYITCDLEVIEENYYEYMKLEDRTLEKRCHTFQRDGSVCVNKVTTEGLEVTRQSTSFPSSSVRGFITEGSSLLLMRLFALKKKVPQNMSFISLDQNLCRIRATFAELGMEQGEEAEECAQLFGISKTLHFSEDNPQTWHCHFLLPDGHMVSRVQLGSPVAMKILEPPTDLGNVSFSWEEDMQMQARYLDRKEELLADNALYMKRHPEIRALISDFLQFLLLRKPDDVFKFTKEYFLPFTPKHSQSESSQSLDP